MDDLLRGANTEQDTLKIKDEDSFILSQGGFEIRKWSSSKERLLNKISFQTSVDKKETNKILSIL